MRYPNLARLSLALAVFAGACSDSPTEPVARLELSEIFAEMSLPPQLGVVTPLASPVAGSCAYNGSVQSFVCAPVTAGGITVTHQYTLLTQSGVPQSAFDRSATAAVRTVSTMKGTIVEEGLSIAIDMEQTLTLSGLLSRPHVLNGTQLLNMSFVVPGEGTVRTTITTTIAGLALPEFGRANAYPSAGSITVATSAGLGIDAITMKLQFNGTSKVDVTITTAGRTERCTIDLAKTGPESSTCSF